MAVVRCENGHFFDDAKHAECPHCKRNAAEIAALQRGRDERTLYRASSEKPSNEAGKRHVEVEFSSAATDSKTVGIFRTNTGYDPVVGWLVCKEGNEKGRDYRLHAGRNFVGRAVKSDVALMDDVQISREDHCSIVYEPNRGAFAIARGKGEGVFVDGARLEETLPLTGGEEIEIGASKFVFIPFCVEGRQW